MANMGDAREFQSRVQRLEVLLGEVEQTADPVARGQTRQIVQAVLDLHAAGFERLLGHLEAAGTSGSAVLDACTRDDIVAGLLLLHGLHPLDVEERVHQALEQVRPYLQSHGGNVELLGVNDGIVRLRLERSCDSCPSSAVTMSHTIEEAILAKAPDVMAVEVEGLGKRPVVESNGRPLVALPVL
jgi:Fe-S cluster biogenesis protein NfuA